MLTPKLSSRPKRGDLKDEPLRTTSSFPALLPISTGATPTAWPPELLISVRAASWSSDAGASPVFGDDSTATTSSNVASTISGVASAQSEADLSTKVILSAVVGSSIASSGASTLTFPFFFIFFFFSFSIEVTGAFPYNMAITSSRLTISLLLFSR